MTQAHIIDYHIIILGGGIVGLTLASLLAKSHLKIAILDNNALLHHFDPSAYDNRVSAINRASENIFRTAGVWEKIKQLRISSYQKMRIWDEKSKHEIHFDATDINEPNLGYIIENKVMLSALENHLREHAHNVTFFPHFQAEDVQISPTFGYIQDTKNRKLKFHLLVGADGKESWLRRKIGMGAQTKHYNQTALVATIHTEKPHQQTAYQRFLAHGPLAFLPLNDPHLCSIVWSTEPQHAEQLVAMEPDTFESELAHAFENCLGATRLHSDRYLFPLNYQHIDHYYQHRIAFVGDAAHTIHPMAGLGLNLGLLDAAALAETILHSHEQERDFGLEKTLRRYELQRKSNNLLTLSIINFLRTFFLNKTPSLSIVKNLGLNLVNQFSPARNTIAKYALGIVGDLPQSAKTPLRPL